MSPKLFFQVMGMEARKLMSYRVDFWVHTAVGFVVEMVIFYFLWKAVFADRGVERIGEYTFEGMMIYYVLVILLGRMVRGVDHGTGISSEIYQGEYTKFILYPAGYLPFKYAQYAGQLLPTLVQLTLFGAAALLFLDLPEEIGATPASVAMGLTVLAAANFMAFLIFYGIEAVAFWADHVWSLLVMERMLTMFFGGYFIPIDLFPDWARQTLLWSPFPYLFYFPVRTLLGQVSPAEWLAGLAVMGLWCGIFLAATRLVWRRGNLQYTGVGI